LKVNTLSQIGEVDVNALKLDLYESFGDVMGDVSCLENFNSILKSKVPDLILTIFHMQDNEAVILHSTGSNAIKLDQKLISKFGTDQLIHTDKHTEVLFAIKNDVFLYLKTKNRDDALIESLLPVLKKFGNYVTCCELNQAHKIQVSQSIFENIIANCSTAIDIIEFEKSDLDLKNGKLFSRNANMMKYLGKSNQPLYSKQVFLKMAAKSLLNEKSQADVYDKMYKSIIEDKLSYDELVFDLNSKEPRYFSAIHQFLELEDRNLLIRTFRDITKERRDEIKMRNQKITLDAVLDSTLDGIYALDKDYRVIAINKQAKKDFIDFEKINVELGADFKEIISKEKFNSWKENYFNKVFQGKSVRYVGEAEQSDGGIRYVENQYSPVIGPDGDVYACLELSRNITDLYKKETALIKSEAKYKNLIETSTAGIVQADQDSIIEYASVQAAKMHGVKPSDMVGKPCQDFLHSDTIKEGKDKIDNLFIHRKDTNFTLRAKHVDKSKKLFVDLKASYLKNADDETKGHFLLTYFDVSDKVIAEYELNKTKASFDLLYTNTTNPIFLYDNINDKFKMANSAAIELLGYTEEDFSKMSWNDIVEKDISLEGQKKKIQESDSNSKNSESSNVLVSKSGTKHHCDISILSANAKKTENFIVAHDYTERIKKNNELKKYIESNLQLENFAYIASHDLKAPLRTVSSFAHLLKSNSYKDLDEKGKSFLDIVLDNSKHMQLLIDDLLEFSRINTQDAKMRKLNMNNIMLRVLSQLKSTLEETKTVLTYDGLPEKLHGDESMLIQLFQNLISNSVKFVKKGVIPKIHISYESSPEFHKFCLEDNGIGISKKDMESIFKIFKKLHNHDSYRGTGLGLTICKRIVEKHFGNIWIESALNQGSKFYFTVGRLNKLK